MLPTRLYRYATLYLRNLERVVAPRMLIAMNVYLDQVPSRYYWVRLLDKIGF